MHRARRAIAPSLAALAVLAALAALPPPLASAAPYQLDTVTTITTPMGFLRPQVVVDPATSTPHVFWIDYDYFTLRHAWRVSGEWVVEAVAYQALDFSAAVAPDGGLAVAWPRSDGRMMCSRGRAGAWVRDTLAMVFVSAFGGFPFDLAMGADGQPALAYVVQPIGSSTRTLYLARRIAGTWSTVAVDSATVAVAAPSLAVPSSGHPGIAWGASDLCLYEGAGALGPFTRTAMDTTSGVPSSLALDRVSERPRMAWRRFDGVRYAARDAAGAWAIADTSFRTGMLTDEQLTLALDRVGAPSIAATQWVPIVPRDAASPAEPDRVATWFCDGPFYATGIVQLVRRATAEGEGGFEIETVPFPRHSLTSRRSLAYLPDGTTLITALTCALPGILFGSDASTVGVPPGPAGPLALAPPSPNPARAGAPLALAFTLPRAGEVGFALHDVSGRTVARREAATFAAGTHALRWTPPALAPGCYWLTMTTGEGRAHRSLVVMR